MLHQFNNQNGPANTARFDISRLVKWDALHYVWTQETSQDFEAWYESMPYCQRVRALDRRESGSFTTTATTITNTSAVFSDSQETVGQSIPPFTTGRLGLDDFRGKNPRWGHGRKSAPVWEHFEEGATIRNGEPRVLCKRCRISMGHGSAGSSGTSSMRSHANSLKCRTAAGRDQVQQQRLTQMAGGVVSHVTTFACMRV